MWRPRDPIRRLGWTPVCFARMGARRERATGVLRVSRSCGRGIAYAATRTRGRHADGVRPPSRSRHPARRRSPAQRLDRRPRARHPRRFRVCAIVIRKRVGRTTRRRGLFLRAGVRCRSGNRRLQHFDGGGRAIFGGCDAVFARNRGALSRFCFRAGCDASPNRRRTGYPIRPAQSRSVAGCGTRSRPSIEQTPREPICVGARVCDAWANIEVPRRFATPLVPNHAISRRFEPPH